MTYNVNLLEILSRLIENHDPPKNLPKGIVRIERVTIEATRIQFTEKINTNLITRIAKEEGYEVKEGDFPPRIIDEGIIIARVGSPSDPGGEQDLYIYPFPPEMERLSIYRRILAIKKGIIDPETESINLEKLHNFNLRIVRFVSRYIREQYP